MKIIITDRSTVSIGGKTYKGGEAVSLKDTDLAQIIIDAGHAISEEKKKERDEAEKALEVDNEAEIAEAK